MKKKGFGVLAVLMLSMLLSVTAFAKGKWKVEEGNRYYYKKELIIFCQRQGSWQPVCGRSQERPMYFQKKGFC